MNLERRLGRRISPRADQRDRHIFANAFQRGIKLAALAIEKGHRVANVQPEYAANVVGLLFVQLQLLACLKFTTDEESG